MKRQILNCGLMFAFATAACSGSAGLEGPGTGATGTGGNTGSSGTGGGGSTGGSVTGGEGSTTGPKNLGVTLTGDLAFKAAFAGEFYGSLPDGGPDLSNLDCRISDGNDLQQWCTTKMTPLNFDAGMSTSLQILDIYVTSVSAAALTYGSADVSQLYGDGGEFATIELTLCSDAGWDFERAIAGQVSYQASSDGIFGQFQAVFPGYPDGGGHLDGTFGAGFCGPLNGY